MTLQALTQPVSPTNVIDGCSVNIKLLVTKWHCIPFDSDPDSDPVPDAILSHHAPELSRINTQSLLTPGRPGGWKWPRP